MILAVALEAALVPIALVAVTLQYSDEAAFKKAYKRETGMTPRESKV